MLVVAVVVVVVVVVVDVAPRKPRYLGIFYLPPYINLIILARIINLIGVSKALFYIRNNFFIKAGFTACNPVPCIHFTLQ